MKLSVIIPARNEERNIASTLRGLIKELESSRIDHEIIVVNDGSTDNTEQVLKQLRQEFPAVHCLTNRSAHGFGLAVRKGLDHFKGDAVVIVMGDSSDDPADVVKYYQKLQEGHECVFGSRFIKGSRVKGYPFHKLILNRLANYFIKLLFGLPYNDTTNSFKCYRRHVIEGIKPLFSNHFNLTVEMPLKAVIRGYKFPFPGPTAFTASQNSKLKKWGAAIFL